MIPLLAWTTLAVAQLALLWHVQRQGVWWIRDRIGGRTRMAYLLSAPGVVAHELSHALMAQALGVPWGKDVGGVTELFRPREHDGGVTLGQVSVAQTDPLRGALVSIAPAVLVPAILAGASWALIGAVFPQDLPDALASSPWWAIILWLVLALSLPLAAFPSPGDHIGVVGGIALAGLAALIVLAVGSHGGVASLETLAASVVQLLFVPAVGAAILYAVTHQRPAGR